MTARTSDIVFSVCLSYLVKYLKIIVNVNPVDITIINNFAVCFDRQKKSPWTTVPTCVCPTSLHPSTLVSQTTSGSLPPQLDWGQTLCADSE